MFKIIKILSQAGRKKMIYLLIMLVSFVVLDGLLTEFLIDGGRAREGKSVFRAAGGGYRLYDIEGSRRAALRLYSVGYLPAFPRVAVIATWIAVVGYGAIVLWNTSLFLLA